MSKSLLDALAEGAWSVSAVVFDLDDMLDNEGRPISERRADAEVRIGVEMEMRECPYGGIRHNRLMNVSALAQISQYYGAVLGEMAAFRRRIAGAQANWADILAGVVDLLAGPAIYLLTQRKPHGPVPAQIAVGHKLAAGYFGVLRSLHERLALGNSLPVSVDSFLDLVEETGALVGASEACAGSLPMIRKASTALLDGSADTQIEIDLVRLDMARCLALQVQLGIFWHLYDRAHLWSIVRGETRAHLTPYNDFLVRKLQSVQNEMDAIAPPRPDVGMLPAALQVEMRDQLAIALNDAADLQTLQEDSHAASELLNEPGSVIRYAGAAAPLAQRVASYLYTYRLFVAELSRLELQLRELLNYPANTPIRLGAAVFPTPQALPWYELILGQHVGEDGHLTGNRVGVRVSSSSEPQ